MKPRGSKWENRWKILQILLGWLSLIILKAISFCSKATHNIFERLKLATLMLFIQGVLQSAWILVAIVNVGMGGWYCKQPLAGLWTSWARLNTAPASQSSWTRHDRSLQRCFPLFCFLLSIYKEGKEWIACEVRERGRNLNPICCSSSRHPPTEQHRGGGRSSEAFHDMKVPCPWDSEPRWVSCGVGQGWEELLQTEKQGLGNASHRHSPWPWWLLLLLLLHLKQYARNHPIS